ncbi:MAG: hypothetical protein KFF46_05330, partial [Desulfobacterales bacterium]|nr:hypothetical protein [Desulfobacterales bacterium]
ATPHQTPRKAENPRVFHLQTGLPQYPSFRFLFLKPPGFWDGKHLSVIPAPGLFLFLLLKLTPLHFAGTAFGPLFDEFNEKTRESDKHCFNVAYAVVDQNNAFLA